MQLYQKIVSPAGRVSYQEYKPAVAPLPTLQIEAEDVVSVLSVMVVAIIKLMEEPLPPSDILHRKIRNTRTELQSLANVGFKKPTPMMVDLGVGAWNAAVKSIQDELQRSHS